MYDPARDCFTAGGDAPTSPLPTSTTITDNSPPPTASPPTLQQPIFSSPSVPSRNNPPPPPLTPLKPVPQYNTSSAAPTPTSVATPGVYSAAQQPLSSTPSTESQMSLSFDFQRPSGTTPAARRMSTIDELLSPAPAGINGEGGRGGFFPRDEHGRDGRRERDGDRSSHITSPSLQSPSQGSPVAAQATSDSQGPAGGEKKKLPSFKYRRDVNEDDARPPPTKRARHHERGGDSYHPRDRDRNRDRPAAPRRRSRSPPPRRDVYGGSRDSYDRGRDRDAYRRQRSPRSRSPPPRPSPPPTNITPRERFPPQPRSPPAHLRLLSNLPREPSPPPSPPSPPRKARRLPGQSARFSTSEREAARKLQLQREEQDRRLAHPTDFNLPVEDVVRSHYNERPEMGIQWRTQSSQIKGLRAMNNWIKSCIIQKFSPNPSLAAAARERGDMQYGGEADERLYVLDVGCGKGGDLRKWKLAPQEVGIYVGVDTAEVSVAQARDRYESMLRERPPQPRGRDRDNRRGPPPLPRLFRADFAVRDCWVDSFSDVQCIREIGFDTAVGPGNRAAARWSQGGGFDVVSMMFCLHYAFESEAKTKRMLSNVAGSLKKGGRFFGTIPSSDVIKDKLTNWAKEQTKEGQASDNTGDGEDKDKEDGNKPRELTWGNSIYKVTFSDEVLPRIHPTTTTTSTTTPAPTSSTTQPHQQWDGRFRPPFGWRYTYHLEEAVTGVPEYVVPWESFRALCEDYNLELIYKKPFHDVWRDEGKNGDGILGGLSERMGVRARGGGGGRRDDRGGWDRDRDTDRGERGDRGREGPVEGVEGTVLSKEEWDACGFYLAFAFRKS